MIDFSSLITLQNTFKDCCYPFYQVRSPDYKIILSLLYDYPRFRCVIIKKYYLFFNAWLPGRHVAFFEIFPHVFPEKREMHFPCLKYLTARLSMASLQRNPQMTNYPVVRHQNQLQRLQGRKWLYETCQVTRKDQRKSERSHALSPG